MERVSRIPIGQRDCYQRKTQIVVLTRGMHHTFPEPVHQKARNNPWLTVQGAATDRRKH
jgi:hypothetical protein